MEEEKIIKRYVVEVQDSFGPDGRDAINHAVNGPEMAVAISMFISELRYRFKHREMSDESYKLYDEIFDLAIEHFGKFNEE